MKKAVVLCSGGMDSCVTTAIAAKEYDIYLLHLNYGQLTEKRELQAFNDIADFYAVKERLIIDTSFLTKIGGSSLTDSSIEIDLNNYDEIPNTYVPFRNANLLAMATSWAETVEVNYIFVGAVEEDSSGYPDCRKSFFDTYNQMIDLGTKPETNITIKTPLIDLKKEEIVKRGLELNAPLHLSWSCYSNSHKACGQCDSCRLRLKGFELAAETDPIPYE